MDWGERMYSNNAFFSSKTSDSMLELASDLVIVVFAWIVVTLNNKRLNIFFPSTGTVVVC